jgi:hypothetical protein
MAPAPAPRKSLGMGELASARTNVPVKMTPAATIKPPVKARPVPQTPEGGIVAQHSAGRLPPYSQMTPSQQAKMDYAAKELAKGPTGKVKGPTGGAPPKEPTPSPGGGEGPKKQKGWLTWGRTGKGIGLGLGVGVPLALGATGLAAASGLSSYMRQPSGTGGYSGRGYPGLRHAVGPYGYTG